MAYRLKAECYYQKRRPLLGDDIINSNALVKNVTPRNVTKLSAAGNGVLCGLAPILTSHSNRAIVGNGFFYFSVGSVPRLCHEDQWDIGRESRES